MSLSPHKIVWNNCLSIIKDNIQSTSFSTWFEPIVPLKLKNNVLTIEVPSHFFREYIEEHFIDLLGHCLRKDGQFGKIGVLRESRFSQ